MRYLRRSLTLLAAATLTAIACQDAPTGLAPDQVPSASLLGGLTLASCTPLPADSVTQVVGPAGGVVVVGPHQLQVPAGALDTLTSITAVAPSDNVNRVRFAPEGLAFSPPATITMSYANCALAWWPIQRRIVYLDDLLTILDVLPSALNGSSQTVSAPLHHFSNYAVAW